jgi:hypothetical protein
MASKGISLHIGLNRVDPSAYQGWDGQLRACEADAASMQTIARSQGYAASPSLLTEKATANTVLDGIKQAATQLQGGDIFLLTYSGHGGRIRDPENPGKQVDTWVLYDRMIISHELYRLWSQFKDGVRIFMTSDSCHSGSMARKLVVKYMMGMASMQSDLLARGSRDEKAARDLAHLKHEGVQAIEAAGIDEDSQARVIPPDILIETCAANQAVYARIARDNPPVPREAITASVLLISGCQDNQTSADGARNGLFTAALLSVWKNGQFSGNYHDFYENILTLMPDTQTPNYFPVGASSPSWTEDKPFVP